MERLPKVEMLDNNSHMYIMDSYISIKQNYYKFISFFALSDTIISLEGFRFPLNNYRLSNMDPLTISNELTAPIGVVTLKGGRILVIQSKEDKK